MPNVEVEISEGLYKILEAIANRETGENHPVTVQDILMVCIHNTIRQDAGAGRGVFADALNRRSSRISVEG